MTWFHSSDVQVWKWTQSKQWKVLWTEFPSSKDTCHILSSSDFTVSWMLKAFLCGLIHREMPLGSSCEVLSSVLLLSVAGLHGSTPGHESLMLGKRRRKSLWMIWVGKKTILGAASQSRERETEDGRSLFVLWKFLWHARAEQCDRMKLIWSRSRTLGILWSNISRRTKDNHNT